MCSRKLRLSGQTCPEETLACVLQKIENSFKHLFVKRSRSIATRKDWVGSVTRMGCWERFSIAEDALTTYHLVVLKCTASTSYVTQIAYVFYPPRSGQRCVCALLQRDRQAISPALTAKMLVCKKPRRLARVAVQHHNRCLWATRGIVLHARQMYAYDRIWRTGGLHVAWTRTNQPSPEDPRSKDPGFHRLRGHDNRMP